MTGSPVRPTCREVEIQWAEGAPLPLEERRKRLRESFGIWKDRTDIPDVRELRTGWERRLERLFGEE